MTDKMTNSNSPARHIVMLDNLDSFTYNLVDEFYQLGFEPKVFRNTLSADFVMSQLEALSGDVMLVLSPGPGAPHQAGCLMELISKAAGKYPILGICLGHQALIEHYGGTVGRAPNIVHGKSSPVHHNGEGAFAGINNPLPVARYHSLVATSMPDNLTVTATTEEPNQSLVMAIEHSDDAVVGFQFHPESVLTTYGSNLLAQAIERVFTLFSSSESGVSDASQSAANSNK
ncbi:aminodeoxychorismate/anthranilate synthase component II [Thalassotalea euphylliae]|uniref:anthranilate synthase n=2 Tax=Thalassotalea euphylliae TaxID=1655234 RepID=A0A3E0TSZ1_9GAMM|nr:aminodeoxychorismate/anthranilate synthase component II [Thalassotalea euphylliae]REL27467.1 aminodeoxychorismate/anthranilate synthase component II [Thalassotalea euphylliae]